MFGHWQLLMLMIALTFDGGHTGEIIGGHEAVPHSRPYMVILQRHIEENHTMFCDGFLLNEVFVMTAAHCHAMNYTVLLGVHNFLKCKGVQHISVEQAFPHEDYDVTDLKNDIMLLKLSSKANFSAIVNPISLPDENNSSMPKSCMVSGWGKTGMNSAYQSPVLMEVNVTLIDNERCPQEKCYCSEGEIGPYEGDSGGPLVCEDGKAYGVVSANFRLNPNDPQINVFIKIPDYRSWITSTMERHGLKRVN